MARQKILVVDDEAHARESLIRGLSTLGIDVDFFSAGDSDDALEFFIQQPPEVAILDLTLNHREGAESGFRLLQSILSRAPETRIIVLTGNSSSELGIRALQRGAAHFLAKPADLNHLAALLKDSLFQSHLRSNLAQFRREREEELAQGFVGNSIQARQLREEIQQLAQTSQSVFIRGETGTGKGLCAKLIHQFSPRRTAPFVRYQPLFASSDLVNSDLFGHKKGAFTGATDNRTGLLEAADKGSLFLDEIDELPHETQVMLLGVLQEKSFRSLGDTQERPVNVRLISASNAELEQKIAANEFRHDLFHRIAHVEIHIPPLRERTDDIPILAQHILGIVSQRESLSPLSISSAALAALGAHRWPGNVRELENVVEGAAWRAFQRRAAEIEESDLRFLGAASHGKCPNLSFREQVQAFEKELVLAALRRNGDSISASARELGLDRGTVKRIAER